MSLKIFVIICSFVKMKKSLQYLGILLVILMTWIHCATPTAPTGGPQDMTPPAIIKAEPPFYSAGFSADKIVIQFDEFIQLKDLNTQLLISPPMAKKPDFKLKGKSLIIEFNDTLKSNTTYNIYMGDAIVDLNESNPVRNFSYIFSTGDQIDSLSVKGKVVDAYTMDAEEEVMVMLYKDISDTLILDSLPFYLPPYYLSKADESGQFRLDYLPQDTFLIFALKDANRNYIYDQPDELIAFSDDLIVPWYLGLKKNIFTDTDTLIALQDSSAIINDSISESADSLLVAHPSDSLNIENQDISLFLFAQMDSLQLLMDASQVKRSHLQFLFKNPSSETNIELLFAEGSTPEMISKKSIFGDTIQIWYSPDTLLSRLDFLAMDHGEILDTVILYINEKSQKTLPPLGYYLDPAKVIVNTPLQLKFDYPLQFYDFSKLLLIEDEDTLVATLNLIGDLKLAGHLHHDWKPEASYELMLPDSQLIDWAGNINDTIRLKFSVQDPATLGNIFIDFSPYSYGINHIVCLKEEDDIVKTIHVNESTELEFLNMSPGTYTLIAIVDQNGNGRWDAGNYIHGIQPEKVVVFPKVLNVRENWDLKEDWLMNE